MLVMRSDEFEFRQSIFDVCIALSTPLEKQLGFFRRFRKGKNGRGHPNAWCNDFRFRHAIAGISVVAVPQHYILIAEHVLVIDPANGARKRCRCRRQQLAFAVVACGCDNIDTVLDQKSHGLHPLRFR